MATTDAVILVGGRGLRLQPLTLSAPKPMLATAGVPFLEHPLSRLREAGIEHVVLSTSYQAEVFSTYFGDGSAFGLDLEYVVEAEPLGTAGGIANVAAHLAGDRVVVLNGDILSGLDFEALLEAHDANRADVTLHLSEVVDARAFGSVPTDDQGWVTAFLEKSPEPITNQINAGAYVFDRSVVDLIPLGRPVSVERETFPELLAGGARVFGHLDRGYWRDLGTPADFVAGSADLVRGVAPTGAHRGPVGDRLVLDGADVHESADIVGGATVGRGCVVGAGAVVDGAVLFDGARVDEGAMVRRSVLGYDTTVGRHATVEDCVVGDRVDIGPDNELKHGLRVWPDCTIGPGSLRFSAPS